MASMAVKLTVTSNVEQCLSKLKAASEYLEGATADDPIALAMTAFGEIDIKKHYTHDIITVPGGLHWVISANPDLQHILDMVP